MIHINDVFQQDLDIWTKSPGLPWKTLGYRTKGDIKRDPDAINRVRLFWHRIKNGDRLRAPDCLAHVRSHVCDLHEEKIRAVWGYPGTLTFGEAVFALPLIRAYQVKQNPIAYGFETALGGARKIFKRFAGPGSYAGLDFKSFDKTIPTWLIRKAFDILECNIDFVHYQDYGVADARRNYKMWDYIQDYFINTTIRLANGTRYRKSSGIASGSYFTQLIGSVCNYILCAWMSLKQLGSLPMDILVLGDDSLIKTHKPLDLSECQELMTSIGMFLNPIKSQMTSELVTMKFLGYRIGNGTPQKDIDDWMTALLFPETPDLSFSQLQSRALGLYYANMCVDMTFANICYGLIRAKPFDLHLSRNFERKLKFIGISLERLKTQELPTPFEFVRLMIM